MIKITSTKRTAGTITDKETQFVSLHLIVFSLAALIAGIVVPIFPAAADPVSPFCSVPTDLLHPWLPVTPEPRELSVPMPRPGSDCQFYRPAWQRFMVATQPVGGV